MPERLTLKKLRDEEWATLLRDPEVEDADEVLVLQAGEEPGLRSEPLHELGVVREILAQELS